MTTYDDHPLSCPMCSIGLEPEALCDCDTDPMCVRCHRVYHVEITWMARRDKLDNQISAALTKGWTGDAA